MHWNDIPFRPPPSMLRRFGLVGCLMLTVLSAWAVRQERWVVGATLLTAGIAVLVLALTYPQALRPVFASVMVATFPLNWVTSHMAMGLIFYGVFTPVAFFFRLVGRDLLTLRLQRARDSYWLKKPRPDGAASYFRQS